MTIDNLTALSARDQWLNICHRWNDLRNRLQPARNTSHDTPTTGTKEQQLPIDTHISDLMHEIEITTRFYAQILVGETDWQPTTSTMPGLLREVATRYGHFTADPDDQAMAHGFCDDAEQYDTKVSRALVKPEPPRYIGPCPTAECTGELTLKPGTTTTMCKRCGATWSESEQQQWLTDKLQDRLMTQVELTQALKSLGTPVPISTIKTWIKRQHLTPTLPDKDDPDDEDHEAPRNLYRLTDAIDLNTTRQQRRVDKAI